MLAAESRELHGLKITGEGGLVPQQLCPLPDRPRAQHGGFLLFDGGFAIMAQ